MKRKKERKGILKSITGSTGLSFDPKCIHICTYILYDTYPENLYDTMIYNRHIQLTLDLYIL